MLPQPRPGDDEDIGILWEGRRRAMKQLPQAFTLLN
jgi:hypothetical protein